MPRSCGDSQLNCTQRKPRGRVPAGAVGKEPKMPVERTHVAAYNYPRVVRIGEDDK
jgi:hypothetical protein